MIANLAGGDGLIVLIIAVVVLVGGSQLPKMARNVGLAGKEFRKAQAESEEEERKKAAAKAAEAAAAAVPPPVPLPASPASAATTAAPSTPEGTISLTPAQLDALLKAREEQARNEAGAN